MTKNIIAIIVIIAVVAGSIFYLSTGKLPVSTSQQSISDEKFQKFSSQEELEDFLKSSQQPGFGYYGRELSAVGGIASVAEASGAPQAKSAADDFSTTNIQVAGVDEADIVKNDGKYIYLVHNNKIQIIDAYPAESANIISEINPEGYIQEIFINDDKLIVFGQEIIKYYPGPIPLAAERAAVGSGGIASPEIWPGPSYYQEPRSFIKIYDVSDREQPELFRELSTEGSYYDSRMIDNNVYAIFNQPTYYWTEPQPIPLPVIIESGVERKLAATEIYHPIYPSYNHQYTNIIALNINSKSEEANMKSFLLGYGENLFVSQDNIYITGQKQVDYRLFQLKVYEEAVLPSLPADLQNKISTIKKEDKKDYVKYSEINNLINDYLQDLSPEARQDLQERIQDKTEELQYDYYKEQQLTIIHKISINNKNIKYEAQGEIPGDILNQFSMDEYNGNLRVATTTQPLYFYRRGIETTEAEKQKNHVYVLDEDLDVIGKLEDLAPGERIYSARFIKDRLYLVTFKKVDPLFVIDLSNPNNPAILGKLKIPGYSDYLHPYDENTIIGLGKEAVEAKEGDFAWYQGVKIALFDVSDVNNPREIAKYNIGDRGTDSEALHEHKAFLFSKEKNLLVIPVTLAEFKKQPTQGWETGEFTFNGAYVFQLTKEDGFKLLGRISHIDQEELLKAGSYPYFSNPVRRSLYMDDYLYTISDGFVKANKLPELEDVKTIKLPKIVYDYPVLY